MVNDNDSNNNPPRKNSRWAYCLEKIKNLSTLATKKYKESKLKKIVSIIEILLAIIGAITTIQLLSQMIFDIFYKYFPKNNINYSIHNNNKEKIIELNPKIGSWKYLQIDYVYPAPTQKLLKEIDLLQKTTTIDLLRISDADSKSYNPLCKLQFESKKDSNPFMPLTSTNINNWVVTIKNFHSATQEDKFLFICPNTNVTPNRITIQDGEGKGFCLDIDTQNNSIKKCKFNDKSLETVILLPK